MAAEMTVMTLGQMIWRRAGAADGLLMSGSCCGRNLSENAACIKH
jgi:hypothetical protein